MIEYNTIVSKDDYTIKFHTDNWERYREIEEYIRENFIDKKVTQVHSSYGFIGFGKC